MSNINYTRTFDKNRLDYVRDADFENEFDDIESNFAIAKSEIDALETYAPAAAASAAAAAAAEANAEAHKDAAAASETAAAGHLTDVNAAIAGFPYKGALNLDLLAGRFGSPASTVNVLSITLDAGGTYDQGWWGDYNGGSIITAEKFIHDNSTNGGAAGPIGTGMQSLLTAMGRTGTNARYGTEFYLLQTKFGTGNASAHPYASNAYLHTVAGASYGFADLDSYVTTGLWFRRVNDTAQPCVWGSSSTSIESLTLDGTAKHYSVDGAANMYFSITNTSWHYALAVHKVLTGYLAVPWPMYGNAVDVPGAGVQIALPFIVPGKIDLTTKWTSPLPGYGEILVP